MKKAVSKVVALLMSVLIAGCGLSMSALAVGDIPDCNGDGNANILDLVRLKKVLAAQNEGSQYDLDRDGKVNANDLVVMSRYLLGITEVHMNEDVADDIF